MNSSASVGAFAPSGDSIVDVVKRLKKSEKASEQVKNAIKSMILNKALSWHPEGLQKLAAERKKLKETLFRPKFNRQVPVTTISQPK